MDHRAMMRSVALAAALAFSSGCSSTGTAIGQLEAPGGGKQVVTLIWKSEALDPARGQISGTLPDGRHFSGRYFEVIKTAPADVYAGAWEGWTPYWPEWRAPWYSGQPRHSEFGAFDWPAFVEIYTGHVVANLHSDDNKQLLRCRFSIAKPLDGPEGGGRGDCQLSSGERIDDVVLAPS
jgi:hypothetical protein